LVRIGILNARDVICPFCFFFEKLMYHALIHYHNIWRNWARCIDCWGISWYCPRSLSNISCIAGFVLNY
jgi:hypothetical protein